MPNTPALSARLASFDALLAQVDVHLAASGVNTSHSPGDGGCTDCGGAPPGHTPPTFPPHHDSRLLHLLPSAPSPRHAPAAASGLVDAMLAAITAASAEKEGGQRERERGGAWCTTSASASDEEEGRGGHRRRPTAARPSHHPTLAAVEALLAASEAERARLAGEVSAARGIATRLEAGLVAAVSRLRAVAGVLEAGALASARLAVMASVLGSGEHRAAAAAVAAALEVEGVEEEEGGATAAPAPPPPRPPSPVPLQDLGNARMVKRRAEGEAGGEACPPPPPPRSAACEEGGREGGCVPGQQAPAVAPRRPVPAHPARVVR